MDNIIYRHFLREAANLHRLLQQLRLGLRMTSHRDMRVWTYLFDNVGIQGKSDLGHARPISDLFLDAVAECEWGTCKNSLSARLS